MQVSPAGRALIERNEGCVLHAYRDVVGVLTIGYGHTGGVFEGESITQEQADLLLATDLEHVYGPGVMSAIGGAPTTQGQFDAMVSLAYNIGVGAFAGSTVCRLHMAADYSGAVDAFALWNKAGGRILPALVRRRAEEASMYFDGSEPIDTPNPYLDRIKQVQQVLGVTADGAFGRHSRAALNALLVATNQPGI